MAGRDATFAGTRPRPGEHLRAGRFFGTPLR